MQVGHGDNPIFPVLSEPFALIAGRALADRTDDMVETALRHMGLQPQRVGGDSADGARYRVHFAALSLLASRAPSDFLDLADPRDSSTSLLAASLPGDWREGGHCWLFVPEASADAASQTLRMREFFKTMVLLIDLFDASHVFWSPARLWSDAPQFRASIAEMLKSGMPPVLHLVAFRQQDAGDGAFVRTRGLALFGGQELEARIPSGWTVAEMVKRLARLALDIILYGPVSERRRLRGLDAGEWVSLSPQAGASPSTVVVEFGSDFG